MLGYFLYGGEQPSRKTGGKDVMSKHFITIEAGCHSVFGSCGWSYTADTNAVYFGSINHEYYFIANGNYVGKEVVVDLCGQFSQFLGEVKAPKNPIRRELWNRGFYRCHMVSDDSRFNGRDWDGYIAEVCGCGITASYGRNSYGQFVLDIDIQKKAVRSADGEIMIATACGRIYGSNEIINLAYVSPKATEYHLRVFKNNMGCNKEVTCRK